MPLPFTADYAEGAEGLCGRQARQQTNYRFARHQLFDCSPLLLRHALDYAETFLNSLGGFD
jgi:hypothetical protein